MAELTRFSIVFIDSITEISRICLAWAELQPESFTDRGKKDLRGTYGLVAREMIGMASTDAARAPETVVFVSVLEKVTDDFGASHWGIQLEGQRTGASCPPSSTKSSRCISSISATASRSALSCAAQTHSAFPRKDRSGKLATFEEPHLGKLLAKLTPPKPTETEGD